MLKKVLLFGIAASVATAMACGGDNKAPVSPSPATVTDAEAAADGSTLKVSAPTPYLPAAGTVVDTLTPNLVVTSSSGKYVGAGSLAYRFAVETAAGTEIYRSEQVTLVTSTNLFAQRVPDALFGYDTAYRWRARAEQGTLVGPWTAYVSLRTYPKPVDPDLVPGYNKPNELWDPLTKGVSIGSPVNMEFIQGQGARTVGNDSHIRYDLLQTMEAGEYSFYVYNLNPLSAGDKTKLMSMQEGTGDITTNDYRFTVEKRGSSYPVPGQVRIRIINGSDDEESIHDNAPFVPPLVKGQWYFVRLTWGSNLVVFRIYNNDPNGALVASSSVSYPGRQYRPTPHTAYVGAPIGRGGPQDASVSNMTVKSVFIGGLGTKRPGSATAVGLDLQ